mmetsp:Transcript_10244/g.15418  ORF Transcript_10244/g.15418 Transcript_10244/m.15418 type:complete len:216 (+) Transcript_10244:2726-3373(+)
MSHTITLTIILLELVTSLHLANPWCFLLLRHMYLHLFSLVCFHRFLLQCLPRYGWCCSWTLLPPCCSPNTFELPGTVVVMCFTSLFTSIQFLFALSASSSRGFRKGGFPVYTVNCCLNCSLHFLLNRFFTERPPALLLLQLSLCSLHLSNRLGRFTAILPIFLPTHYSCCPAVGTLPIIRSLVHGCNFWPGTFHVKNKVARSTAEQFSWCVAYLT